jgi:hypothetical protein
MVNCDLDEILGANSTSSLSSSKLGMTVVGGGLPPNLMES